MKLEEIITKYAVPDPSIVGKLPRGGIQLDFVGHAEITRILIDIDPMWSWEPCGWNNGRPAITETNGMATMWAHLTILGKSILGVGSVRADKPDLDKELIGDFLRNASMRFGICLSLWSKSEWDESKTAVAGKPQAGKAAASPVTDENSPLTKIQVKQFVEACEKAGITPSAVAEKAGLNWAGQILQKNLSTLRTAFTEAHCCANY
jgi:hypothetical protein